MDRISPQQIILLVILFLIASGGSKVAFFLFVAAIFYIILKKKYSIDIIKLLKKKSMPEVININPSGLGNISSKAKNIGYLVIITIIVIVFLVNAIRIVDAGYTGVYSLFGKVKDTEYSSGLHLINPLAKITPMSIRTEEYTMSILTGEGKKTGADSIAALTKEGLNVDLDITVLYKLDEQSASDIYKNVGLNYEEKIIRPAIRSSIREIIAQYEAKDIYSEKRSEAADKIVEDLKVQMDPRGIILEEVLLRNVQLPDKLAQSIQEKLQAEQEAEKYDFILTKEVKEKERKIIEAEGQRDAQKIINESLSTNYLYYLYINELKDREGTIYVPTGSNTGVPLFRNLGQ